MKGVILVLLAGSGLVNAMPMERSGGVREAWVREGELPSAIAYFEFAAILAGERTDRHASAHLLADAFDVKGVDQLDADLLEEIHAYGAVLVSHYEAMQLEELEAKIRILCKPSREQSAAARYAALNIADDVGRSVRQKYLSIFLAGLPGHRRTAFEAFLEEIKYSISYVKLDNRPADPLAGADPQMAEINADECARLQTRYAKILTKGGAHDAL